MKRTALRRRGKSPRAKLRAVLDNLVCLYAKMRDKRNSPMCRICGKKPYKVGYHLVPKKKGDAVRWDPANLVAACTQCNYGESMNREIYRDKHIALFGDAFLAIEEKSRQIVKFSMDD